MSNLVGIGVAGFRSFSAPEPQLLAPLTKVNLIVGQNNAGKSNVLDFVEAICDAATKSKDPSPALHEDQFSQPSGLASMPLILTYDLAELPARPSDVPERAWQKLLAVLGQPFRLQFTVDRKTGGRELADERLMELDRRLREVPLEMSHLSRALANGVSGGRRGDDTRRVIRKIAEAARFPRVHKVPAFRRVAGDAEDGEYGSGLIRRLADLERPDAAVYVEERAKFDAIQEFLRAVYEDETIILTIPNTGSTINISTDSNPPLPLNRYGTGIQQIVMLAVAAVINQNRLLLLEEPEIHLHPVMQRTFLRFLADHTNNQYLIATHSAHMLDSDIASIFHVRKIEGVSIIQQISKPGEIAEAAADLGYRASDLVQCNAVIWVEGPSDRTYTKHWLGLAAPDLIEGIHYSIMFYGGALLGHLSGDEESIDEFVKLQRLNRNIAIIIDSDLTSPGPLTSNKTRVINEVEGAGGLAWVTWGYTIENYVPTDILNASVKAVHPSAGKTATQRRTNPLHRDHIRIASPNKAAIAKRVIEHWEDLTDARSDLQERVSALADFIRTANGGIAAQPELTPEPGDPDAALTI